GRKIVNHQNLDVFLYHLALSIKNKYIFSRNEATTLVCVDTNRAANSASEALFISARANQNTFTHFCHRHRFHGSSYQQSLSRHTKHLATGLILSECYRASLTQRQQALRTIFSHANQNSADRIFSSDLGRRVKQHID